MEQLCTVRLPAGSSQVQNTVGLNGYPHAHITEKADAIVNHVCNEDGARLAMSRVEASFYWRIP